LAVVNTGKVVAAKAVFSQVCLPGADAEEELQQEGRSKSTHTSKSNKQCTSMPRYKGVAAIVAAESFAVAGVTQPVAAAAAAA
jgi:hypothetical protein